MGPDARDQNSTTTSLLVHRAWTVSMKRIMRSRSDMIIELVRMPSPKKRTPRMKRAVGDAGRDEEDVRAGRQVALGVDALRVRDAHRLHALFLARAWSGTRRRLHAAVEAAERRRGEHALGRAADAHDGVHVRAAHGGRDAGREVAVADQLDARAGLADVVDQLLVPRPVEHDDDQVLRRAVRASARSPSGCPRPARRCRSRSCAAGPTMIFSM